MKKCSTAASKSMEQLVEVTKSKSTDGATTSVVQQRETQSCQHFSLQGYVADMRVKNSIFCNPFDGFRSAENIWDKLQGPLDVPRFRSSRCENCVRRVVHSRTSDEKGLNAEQNILQICIPGPGNNLSVEQGAAGGDSNYKAPIDVITLDDSEGKVPIEVTILDDSEDEAPIEVLMLDDSEDEGVIQLLPSLEEPTKDEEKASAGNGVTTNTLRQTEQRPCLDKGKSIIIEVEDDGEEFDKQPQETRKAIGESSRPWGDTEVEDKDQTSGFLEPSRNLNRGPPYGQAVLDNLNARIASTANTLRNQQQQRRNICSSSTLFFKDISLCLCIPGTEGNQKKKNEGTSVESQRKRKATVDALDNVSESSLKSRRQMEMGNFLQKQ